jgi:hypothetical protein
MYATGNGKPVLKVNQYSFKHCRTSLLLFASGLSLLRFFRDDRGNGLFPLDFPSSVLEFGYKIIPDNVNTPVRVFHCHH